MYWNLYVLLISRRYFILFYFIHFNIFIYFPRDQWLLGVGEERDIIMYDRTLIHLILKLDSIGLLLIHREWHQIDWFRELIPLSKNPSSCMLFQGFFFYVGWLTGTLMYAVGYVEHWGVSKIIRLHCSICKSALFFIIQHKTPWALANHIVCGCCSGCLSTSIN